MVYSREIQFDCDGDAHHEPVALVRLVSVQLIADKESEFLQNL